jgi:hypothetical protein
MAGKSRNFPVNNRIGNIPIDGSPTALLNMLQYDSVNNKFIWVETSGGSMGDLEFLAEKEKTGDLVHASGLVTVQSTICSIVPANGKTFFLANATISFSGSDANASSILENDGVEVDKGRNSSGDFVYLSQIKSDSLIGDGVKEYRIQNTVGGAGLKMGTIEGWIEDTV